MGTPWFGVYGNDRMKRTVILTKQIADSGQRRQVNGVAVNAKSDKSDVVFDTIVVCLMQFRHAKMRSLLRKLRWLYRKFWRLRRKLRRLRSQKMRLLRLRESERGLIFQLTQIREA